MKSESNGGQLLADPLRRAQHKCFTDMHGELKHDVGAMRWPTEREARGAVFRGNNDYMDLRSASWAIARDVRDKEIYFIEQWEERGGWPSRAALLPIAERWSDVAGGLDLGVTSVVYAIAAAGGVPVASCNGGAFGGRHMDDLPGVAFWWPRASLSKLLECVEQAGMSTWMYGHGAIVVGGNYIRRFLLLADELHKRRDDLGRAR